MDFKDQNDRDRRRFIRSLFIAFLLIIIVPVVLSILGSLFVALLSISFGLLVAALVLIASPILLFLMPGVLNLTLPGGALFFMGVGALALFVMSIAIIIRIIKSIFRKSLDLIKGLF